MKQALALTFAALALGACADYQYVYDYGPGGPRGHYVGPFEHPHARADLACAHVAYSGPYENGYREPYYVGPYCADAPTTATLASATVPSAP
jgi:hypothetical protein